MADAKQCDICGCFYVEDRNTLSPIYNATICDSSVELDLCDDCLGELDNFIASINFKAKSNTRISYITNLRKESK